MNPEIKNCQNCKAQFTIEPEDFSFYEKMDVPPPTWCPECRMQRRMAFRNERAFYKRKCDSCKKDIISLFSENSPYVVFCTSCWYQDTWDGLQYSQDIDWNKPLLEQFHELNLKVPQRAIINTKSINSEYTNFSPENKNCYMCVSTLQSEDCLHGSRVFYSQDCVDCLEIQNSELCYECIHCEQCSKCRFCEYSQNLVDCAYCYDTKGLISCWGCVGLRNKSHCFLNEQLTKEKYEKKLKSLNQTIEKDKVLAEFSNLLGKYPHKYAHVLNNLNCSGDNIQDSKNSHNVYFVRRNENSKFVFTGNDLKDEYDIISDDESQLAYELMSAYQEYQVAFSTICWTCRDVRYSNLCFDSSNLFACVALRNKQNCILNKQYSKEEYEAFLPKIIEHMKAMPYADKWNRKYPYGEFFPVELSPFAYNETVAQEYFPLSKESAPKLGFRWHESQERNYRTTLPPEEIPENINAVNDDITNQIIGCDHKGDCDHQCTTAFRIIPSEIQLYRRMSIALPKLCPNCRHYRRLHQRNPMKLWHRSCMCKQTNHTHSGKCSIEFETTYSPGRPEIVYCEQCYQAEVA